MTLIIGLPVISTGISLEMKPVILILILGIFQLGIPYILYTTAIKVCWIVLIRHWLCFSKSEILKLNEIVFLKKLGLEPFSKKINIKYFKNFIFNKKKKY